MPLTSPSPLVHSYAVDFLVAERRVGKRRQYRVRWVGYGVADDTWEDARSVLTPVLIENFERVRDCGGLAAAVREQAHRLRLSSAHLATRAGVEASEWLAREGVIEATELPAAFELTSESVSDACGIPDGVERALREWLETSWTRDRVAAEALPPGWTEEERVTCTDRTYYVYHGPEGERASSRSAAWRIATEVPDAMEDPTSAAIAELASSLEAWGGSRALTQSITQHWTAVAYMRPDNGRPYHIFVSPDGKRLRSRTAVAKHLGLSTHSTAPPSGSAASAGAAPATGRPLPSSTWVECDRCKKWRRLPFASARQVLPRVWLCEMNPDPLHDACEYEEEREEDPAEEDLAADAERSDDDDEAAGGGVLGASPEETSPPNVSHAGGDAHGARKRPREDETRGRHTPPAGCYPPAVCASQYARPRPCCPPLTAPDRPRPPPTAPSGLEWPRVALDCHLPSLLDAPPRVNSEHPRRPSRPGRYAEEHCMHSLDGSTWRVEMSISQSQCWTHHWVYVDPTVTEGVGPTSRRPAYAELPPPLPPAARGDCRYCGRSFALRGNGLKQHETQCAAREQDGRAAASYLAEHTQLVRRIEHHMSSYHLNMSQLASQLGLSSSATLSAWLGRTRDRMNPQALLRIDVLAAKLLQGCEPHADATTPPLVELPPPATEAGTVGDVSDALELPPSREPLVTGPPPFTGSPPAEMDTSPSERPPPASAEAAATALLAPTPPEASGMDTSPSAATESAAITAEQHDTHDGADAPGGRGDLSGSRAGYWGCGGVESDEDDDEVLLVDAFDFDDDEPAAAAPPLADAAAPPVAMPLQLSMAPAAAAAAAAATTTAVSSATAATSATAPAAATAPATATAATAPAAAKSERGKCQYCGRSYALRGNGLKQHEAQCHSRPGHFAPPLPKVNVLSAYSKPCSTCGLSWSCGPCVATASCPRCSPIARCSTCRSIRSKVMREGLPEGDQPSAASAASAFASAAASASSAAPYPPPTALCLGLLTTDGGVRVQARLEARRALPPPAPPPPPSPRPPPPPLRTSSAEVADLSGSRAQRKRQRPEFYSGDAPSALARSLARPDVHDGAAAAGRVPRTVDNRAAPSEGSDDHEPTEEEMRAEVMPVATKWQTVRSPPAPPPRCACGEACVWLRSRWFCAREADGCAFESEVRSAPPGPALSPLAPRLSRPPRPSPSRPPTPTPLRDTRPAPSPPFPPSRCHRSRRLSRRSARATRPRRASGSWAVGGAPATRTPDAA